MLQRSIKALLLAAGMALAFSGAAEAKTLKLAHSTWVGYGPLYIARDKGFFKEEGVDIELVVMEDTPAKMGALMAGQIDLVASTVDEFPIYMTPGKSLHYILAVDNSKGGDGIVATKDIKTIADLKGKKVAHTSPSSNSGHLAPLALFPKEGITPGKDYNIVFSGKHDQSLAGVLKGDYDAAPITSDIYDRWVMRGQMKADDVRIIYRSGTFPTSAFAHSHDLAPALADKVKKCFFDYKFSPELQKEFLGDDRFLPVNYKKDWELVRAVAVASGTPYNRAQFDKENAKKK